jgi:hypothetical protein
MAIERKKVVQKQEVKKVISTGKKLKKNFNFAQLPDAIVDGKFICETGSKVIVERSKNGKNFLSICTIYEISDKGYVSTFDETIEQYFTFSLEQPPKVLKIYN